VAAGDFIYEPPSQAPTRLAFDVHNYIALHRAHFEKVGRGADYVKTLFS
jgi:hypothetical protein